MEHHIRVATVLTELLDNKFPFLGLRFGIDPLLDLIPFAGDFVATALSFYLVWIAYRIRVPQDKIHEMVGNIIMDFVIGLIPFLGAVGDVFYKANSKNLKILKQYYKPAVEGEILSSSALAPSIYR